MFSIFRSKDEVMTAEEKKRLVEAIKSVEGRTSGEVRLYIEGECPADTPMLRCIELFQHLDMHKTKLRNAVLIYLATNDRKYAIFGDKGIYEKAGVSYWQSKANVLVEHLQKGALALGLEKTIIEIGQSLSEFYPPNVNNKNELPDDIVFGKF